MVYYDYRSINSGNLMNKNAILQYQDVNERGIGALNLSGVTYVLKTKRVCIEKKIFLVAHVIGFYFNQIIPYRSKISF